MINIDQEQQIYKHIYDLCKKYGNGIHINQTTYAFSIWGLLDVSDGFYKEFFDIDRIVILKQTPYYINFNFVEDYKDIIKI